MLNLTVYTVKSFAIFPFRNATIVSFVLASENESTDLTHTALFSHLVFESKKTVFYWAVIMERGQCCYFILYTILTLNHVYFILLQSNRDIQKPQLDKTGSKQRWICWEFCLMKLILAANLKTQKQKHLFSHFHCVQIQHSIKHCPKSYLYHT